jgi:hypothetical protein
VSADVDQQRRLTGDIEELGVRQPLGPFTVVVHERGRVREAERVHDAAEIRDVQRPLERRGGATAVDADVAADLLDEVHREPEPLQSVHPAGDDPGVAAVQRLVADDAADDDRAHATRSALLRARVSVAASP